MLSPLQAKGLVEQPADLQGLVEASIAPTNAMQVLPECVVYQRSCTAGFNLMSCSKCCAQLGKRPSWNAAWLIRRSCTNQIVHLSLGGS